MCPRISATCSGPCRASQVVRGFEVVDQSDRSGIGARRIDIVEPVGSSIHLNEGRWSMTLVGGILIILSASLASTNYLIDQEVPMKLFAFVKAHISSKLTFLLIINCFPSA